jgi:hypothetical protein
MRRCTIILALLFIFQNARQESSNKDLSNGGSNTRKTMNGQRSKGETKKGVPSGEGSGPGKKQNPCNSCGTCNPNPCFCYGKVLSCPK